MKKKRKKRSAVNKIKIAIVILIPVIAAGLFFFKFTHRKTTPPPVFEEEYVTLNRLKKTIDIMTGASSMRWFPEDYEKKFIERDAILENAKKEKLLSDKCMEAVVE